MVKRSVPPFLSAGSRTFGQRVRADVPCYTTAVNAELAGTIALVLVGCGGAPAPVVATQVAPVQAAPIAVRAEVGALPAGVTTEAIACSGGSSDACNGRDDDCDGRIDEGCGWESGPVQITLAWDTGADLDLYVTEPSGFTISYLDRSSPSGGVLDHDARGACIPGG